MTKCKLHPNKMEIELTIYEDCLNLIDKFVECKNPCFKTFCQQWHEAKFQHIYSVQTTTIEIIQTTKTIFHMAKRILCGKGEFEKHTSDQIDNPQISRRFGGIYLMYAIYFKQPTNKYVKVQMSNETWRNLVTFIESLPGNNTNDEVRYIFWSLYKEDAFRFTVMDYDLGLENLIDYDRLCDVYNGNKYVDVVRVKLKQKLTAIAEAEDILPNMISLEDQYNNLKKSLIIDKSEKPLPATKIFHDIQDAIKNIHDIMNDDNEHVLPSVKSNDIKKELKRKAAGYRTNDEESPADDSFRQEEIKKRCGRPTVRQIMTQELPEFINDDLKENSSEEEIEKKKP